LTFISHLKRRSKIFGDIGLRLSRTITRQCGIKFSWEFKRGPDAEIRDTNTKNLCGICILHLADIILSGENIPERIPGEGKHHKFGMNKRMELKQNERYKPSDAFSSKG
jgi:hypothetical protein